MEIDLGSFVGLVFFVIVYVWCPFLFFCRDELFARRADRASCWLPRAHEECLLASDCMNEQMYSSREIDDGLAGASF